MADCSSRRESASMEPIEPAVDVGSYNVFMSRNAISTIPAKIVSIVRAANYVIITDTNVGRIYGERYLSVFKNATNSRVLYREVQAGEPSKCRAVKEQIEDWMLSEGCNRDTCMVALGGGVVGDLCGFVAATYMRGVPFVQCPTTLLAMVDSSVGGKTGIDVPAGKNLIGAFHNPKAVIMDVEFLKTLPMREYRNGLAEAIKMGAIQSSELFVTFERNVDKILAMDGYLLKRIISESVRLKAETCKIDWQERGLRATLNFGHSIGHGIETLVAPDLVHGECVAIGMVLECQLAYRLGVLSQADADRVTACLNAYGLPTVPPKKAVPSKVMEVMAVDKKNRGGVKMIVLISSVGVVKPNPNAQAQGKNPYVTPVKDEDIAAVLNMYHRAKL